MPGFFRFILFKQTMSLFFKNKMHESEKKIHQWEKGHLLYYN